LVRTKALAAESQASGARSALMRSIGTTTPPRALFFKSFFVKRFWGLLVYSPAFFFNGGALSAVLGSSGWLCGLGLGFTGKRPCLCSSTTISLYYLSLLNCPVPAAVAGKAVSIPQCFWPAPPTWALGGFVPSPNSSPPSPPLASASLSASLLACVSNLMLLNCPAGRVASNLRSLGWQQLLSVASPCIRQKPARPAAAAPVGAPRAIFSSLRPAVSLASSAAASSSSTFVFFFFGVP
jgi:hypothetical protein